MLELGNGYHFSIKDFAWVANPSSKFEGLFMKHLKTCPECHSSLKLHSDGETQYCTICKYWTKVGTVRLDSIMIYG